MPILTVENITKYFSDCAVLDDVSFSVNEGDKIAFIGNNGAGKSTLFKIIKGTLDPDDGKILLHGNTIVGFMSQNMDEQDLSASTLKPRRLIDLELRKSELETEMSASHDDEQKLHRIMDEYSSVCAEYESFGGYDFDYRMAEALAGLGLGNLNSEQREDLMTLSGGEKMRVCLAQLIVSRPDILMLDEPTNHLDIEATEWLENYLSSYGGSVFVISHDRRFINKISNRIIELQDGRIRDYRGNYDSYVIQKKEFLKTQAALVANLEKELEHQLDVKQTMLSHRNISGYHQREKMVEKLQDILTRERDKLPSGQGSMKFTVVPEPKDGASDKLMLKVENVSKRFGDGPLIFENISFELTAGRKVFLCGPNGCGKSTLLTMLLGIQGGFEGSVFISATATCGFMEQFVPFSDESVSCLDELVSRSDMTWTEARRMLARFGFRGEEVHKTISVLSGGERSRLYLCCLLQEKPDILFLDEPTNHLDIESREVLEDALKEYSGCIVCVSHDRFFIEKCADFILGFYGGTAHTYDTYRYYRNDVTTRIREKRAATRPAAPAASEAASAIEAVSAEVSSEAPAAAKTVPAGTNKALNRREAAKRRERIRELEQLIAQKEAEQTELESAFTRDAGPEEYRIYADNSQLIEQMYEEYMQLSEQEEISEK